VGVLIGSSRCYQPPSHPGRDASGPGAQAPQRQVGQAGWVVADVGGVEGRPEWHDLVDPVDDPRAEGDLVRDKPAIAHGSATP
jgi:hypothetical protein